jgi:Tol biopolymer transport system component
MLRGVAAAVTLVAALTIASDGSSTRKHDPAQNGWIVFASDRESGAGAGQFRLYRLEPIGGRVLRLRSLVGREPAWSPDGSLIAFVNARSRLVVANPEGTAASFLTRGHVRVGDPSWSPDGSQLVFHVPGTRSRGDLAVVNADGKGLRHLTRTPGGEIQPAWSPEGSLIAFAGRPAGLDAAETEIYVVRPDGRGLRRLTRNEFLDMSPEWSPDGSLIAFESGREPGRFNSELWTMARDGSSERRVQRAADPSGFPSWSDSTPSWSPDGNWLVYATNQTNHPENVFIVRPDGQDKTDLTPETQSSDVDPAWQPVCSHPGTERRDRLQGSSVDDRVCGFAGDDSITGGLGRDGLYGGRGKDTLRATDGSFDIVGCGAGRDLVFADRIDRVGVDCEGVRRR